MVYLKLRPCVSVPALRSCYINFVHLSPVLSDSTHVLLHGCVRAHAVEEFVLLAVLLDDLPGALVVARQHSSHHHKVCPGAWRGKWEGE